MINAIRVAAVAAAAVVCCALLVAGGDRDAAAAPGAVLALAFNEGAGTTTADASGSGNNGALAGPSWTTAGKYGGALTFDGSNDYVTVADANSLDLVSGMTLEAWVRPTASGSWRTLLMKERSGQLAYAIYANTDTNRPSGEIGRVSTFNVEVRGAAQLALNAWTHVAVTYDRQALRLYVNGTVAATTTGSGDIITSTLPLRIGGNLVWGEYFTGTIDEVRVYPRALTAAEIQEDMNTPIGGSPPAATATPTPTQTATASSQATATPTPTGAAPPPATSTATFMPLPPTATATRTPTATPSAPTPPPPPGSQTMGDWSAVTDWPLYAIHMAQLYTGDFLVYGSELGTTNARVFRPSTNSFTTVPVGSGLFCSGHSELPDGRLLVVGGFAGFATGIRDVNFFNPATNAWTRGPSMQYARWYPSATRLADGRVVVVSGQISPDIWADTPEVWNPATNTWSTLPLNTSSIHEGGYPLSYLLPDGRIFIAAASSKNTGILNPNAPSWTATGQLPFAFGAFAHYRPGKLLYTGGGPTWDGPTIRSASLVDLNGGSPSYRSVQSMSYPRFQHNLVVLADGDVLAVGGSDRLNVNAGTGSTPAEIFDVQTETWATVDAMRDPRNYHSTALLMPDGRVLAAGGDYSFADHAEIYSPPYLFRGARPAVGSSPVGFNHGQTFVVQTPDAADIASVALVPIASVTHTLNMEQRYVPLSFTRGTGQLQVQAPSSANIAPAGYYMLFLVNTNGVPAVAPVVNLGGGGGGGDAEQPNVSLTNPADGVTVSGAITLSATASDNVGVAGVQFTVDGVNVGAEDATAPYSVSWNSTSVANGAHAVAARARDAAGNSRTASVSVNVSNGGGGSPSDLAAAYNFNGSGATLTDGSGRGNHGTISGAAWTSAGKYGGALTFDGTNDWVTVADSASLDLTTGMTLEAWVRPTAIDGWRTVFLKERPGNLVYAIFANTGNNRPSGEIGTAGGNFDVRGTGQLPLNTWTHLAVTFDGVTLRLYVNGALVRSKAVAGSLLASSGQLVIGGSSVWGEYFKGQIDEVRVYNRARSTSEIQSDMNTALP
jgi:hypothetical protein